MLGLAAPRPLVARVLELWGAGQAIGVHDSVAEAAIAEGQERGSGPVGTGPPAERGADRRPGAAALDGLLLRVARGDAEAFAGVYDQVASAVYSLVLRIPGDQSRAEQGCPSSITSRNTVPDESSRPACFSDPA